MKSYHDTCQLIGLQMSPGCPCGAENLSLEEAWLPINILSATNLRGGNRSHATQRKVDYHFWVELHLLALPTVHIPDMENC